MISSHAVLIDCTDAALGPGNPGVVRTTRQLTRALLAGNAIRPVFAVWDRRLRHYRSLTADERATLGTYGGPHVQEAPLEDTSLLFLSEAPMDGQIAARMLWANARGMKVAGLLYDLIPLTHPSLCVPGIVEHFPEYLEAICTSDALFAISSESLRQLEHHASAAGLPLPVRRLTVSLPAQLGRHARETSPPPPGTIRCLSVGSIEPRKNQLALVSAFDRLHRRRPELRFELALVGGQVAGAEALAEAVDALARETKLFRWLGILDDEDLAALYRSAAFTVYPSLVEGFGLPIMESLWMGRPCLCHEAGIMAELAAGGGCMTTDMNDVDAIERALERLVSDFAFRERLGLQARQRELHDWGTYSAAIARELLKCSDGG